MNAPGTPQGRAPVPLRCPRCGANVAPEQDWCLECGAPARTRLAPTPNWRLPVAALALIVVLAGLALAVAFTQLTADDGTVTAAPATTAPVQPDETGTESVPSAPAAAPTSPATSPSTAAPSSTATPPPTAG